MWSRERKAGFESFHEYRSRMDVAADGTLIFVSQHRDQDEAVLFSLTERRVIERHRFADLVGLLSPSFSADGRRFVVSGLSRDGHSDLYLYDRDRSRLRRLTMIGTRISIGVLPLGGGGGLGLRPGGGAGVGARLRTLSPRPDERGDSTADPRGVGRCCPRL